MELVVLEVNQDLEAYRLGASEGHISDFSWTPVVRNYLHSSSTVEKEL